MAQYSHVISIILVAAAVCPPALTAPITSANVSVTAVDDQTGTSQIAVDNPLCFETGMRVLKEKGNNAVDAAVASLLCLGVVNFQSSGIGGGMVMVVAEKDPNGGEPKVTVIDAREVAPDSVDSSMGLEYTDDLAQIGPSSIAVPGELRGIEMALQMFSNNTEEKRNALLADAIKYAEDGFPASEHLANAVQSAIVHGSKPHSFKRHQSASWFQELKMLVQKDDGSGEYVQKKGDRIRPRPNLTATLKAIVQNGFSEIYNGTTATNLRSDIRTVCAGGPGFCRELQDIISSQELEEYEAKTRIPFKFSYDTSSGYDVYTAPAPYGGPALAVFLGIVTTKVGMTSLEYNVYHYLTEAAKFAASYRMKLGDPDFNSKAHVTPDQAKADTEVIINKLNKENEQARPATDLSYYGFESGKKADGMGTTHLSVITPNMAVAVTSSINDLFGSGFLSPSTGILLNNGMEGFDLGKRFPLNKIQPRKRPLSAKCPTIVVDSKGNFKLVTGAAGGKRIPPAVGQTMFYALTRKTPAKVASCQPRVYADLLKDNDPNITQQVEKNGSSKVPGLGISSKTLMWLRMDHNQPDYENYSAISVVQSILDVSGILDAHSDVRKFGGDCYNTTPNKIFTTSWGIHPNVKLLLLFFSFVVQYVCIHL